MGVMVVILLIAGNMVLPWLPVVVGVVVLHAIFVLGVGLVLAPLNAYFRDVEHFTAIALNIWFWATPIIYPLEVLYKDNGQPHELLGLSVPRLMNFNPMYHFVSAYRDLLYHLRAPEPKAWLYMATAAALSLAVGRLVFNRLEARLAEEL
jgi:ABC-2 type transport system permease protein